ncbi:MAG: hypothetical protein ACYCOR_19250 [Acidobacteriaceae bacterium]
MNFNLAKILLRPMRFRSAILLFVLVVYVSLTLLIFFEAVVPSFAQGTTSDEFSVDSTVYVYFADSLREQRNDPWVITSMAHFPNTLWMPVFLSLFLNSAFLIMLTNFSVVIFSIWLLKGSCTFSLATFLPLLLINPTTTTSLLCVNKEVFDLLALSLFLYARAKRNRWLFVAAMALALLNRWEMCMVFMVFVLAQSRLNPFRKKRMTTLLVLVLALNFAMPFWAEKVLAARFVEASSGNTIAMLDRLQINYLYVLAVIPKIAENLFGQLLNRMVWEVGSSWLLINFFSNVSSAIVALIASAKHILTLRNDFVYFGMIGAVIVAQSLAVQPRYFYFIYVLFCLQISLLTADRKKGHVRLRSLHTEITHA